MYDKEYFLNKKKDLEKIIADNTQKSREQILKALKHDIIASTSIERAKRLRDENGIYVIGQTYLHQFLTFPFFAMYMAFDAEDYYKKSPFFMDNVKTICKRLGWFAIGLVATATTVLPLAGCATHLIHKGLDHLHVKQSIKYQRKADKAAADLKYVNEELAKLNTIENSYESKTAKVERFEEMKLTTKKPISGLKNRQDEKNDLSM